MITINGTIPCSYITMLYFLFFHLICLHVATQGMSDLLSPILFVMEDESESFWCFVALMERLGPNFNRDQNGMHTQLFAISKVSSSSSPVWKTKLIWHLKLYLKTWGYDLVIFDPLLLLLLFLVIWKVFLRDRSFFCYSPSK